MKGKGREDRKLPIADSTAVKFFPEQFFMQHCALVDENNLIGRLGFSFFKFVGTYKCI